jgi:MerR family transcriptional regulator, thiopeptide resistance regulator
VGLSLADIRAVVGRPSNDAGSMLQKRLVQIDAEIDRLRSHQRVILRLLGNRKFRRAEMITKDKWVAIMKGCGFTDDQMHRWHVEFERAAPEEHQEFLEFLHIPAEEIGRIRGWSRNGEVRSDT